MMKIDNSAKSKNQTTLGQFWSSTGPKVSKTNLKNEIIIQEDDDIELLAAMEQFEKKNSASHPIMTTTTTATKTTTETASTSKWPISFKSEQNSKQKNEAPVSAPVNENEHLHTYSDFDRQAGRMWIYPTNYEKRDYQHKIVSMALFHNTLVVLPTGLGKTFIAAVVMFNYCRWYPTGKIIFTAPTKPLVAQQMEACAKVMGIRKSEMCEMTGGVSPEERRRLWLEKRVFFLTPQTLNNDLVKTTCPWSKIRCLVVDEAHRALGQHAYCQVVQELCKNGEDYRILALSATPGNNVEAVQNVISNLKISHIEMFTDDSPGIKKYSFDKIIDKIVVGPNQLMQNLRRCILNVLKQPVETLNRLGIIYQKSPEYVTHGSIIMTMKRIAKDKPTNLNDRQYQEAKSAMFFSISFFHALDELEKHGLQSVYNFFKKKLTEDKKNNILHATFRNNTELNEIYIELQNLFDLSQVTTEQRCKTSLQIAHPKLSKLRECVVEHFQTFERTKTKPTDQTRVIIFSEKRDSVREITELLQQDRPLIKPMAFIGQATTHAAGQGINQKLQKKVVTDFRAGGYNVLIATSIGEEGLDIGSVDLIICFDALKSPIRLVQRMGRTGRARQGRIVLLMTEGKEERTYVEGEMQQKRIFKLIVDGARMLELYRSNLRMVPQDIQPICQEMTIKVNDETDLSDKDSKKKFKTNDSDFKTMINKTKQQENLLKLFRKDKLLNDNEFYHWVRNYQLNDENDDDENPVMPMKDRLKLMIETATRKWSNEQREIQSPSMHSSRTETFVDFMKNYTNERVYIDIPDHTWPMDESISKPELTPIETSISDRPKMPSPYDRSKLKEQIQNKRACSPLDLAKMPQECDQLLNLQPIIQQQKQPPREETYDEEIDCGDLFGQSFNRQPIVQQHQLPQEEMHDDDDEIDCGDLFGQSLNSRPTFEQQKQSQQEKIHDDDEEIDCGDLFGQSLNSRPTFEHQTQPPPPQEEIHEEEEIDCGDLFGQSLNPQPTFEQQKQPQQEKIHDDDEEIDCGDLFGQSLNSRPTFEQQKQPQQEKIHDDEIDCGDLFGTGSTFDITCLHPEPTLPITASSTEPEAIRDDNDNIGNFNITMDDLFPASQASHSSPTLQLNDVKSQPKTVFDDDDMDDDELLEAFNRHAEDSSNKIIKPSPVLVLTNRVNTQIQSNIPTADVTLPKFDLEFSFDDLDNSGEQTDNVLNLTIAEAVNKNNVATHCDKFETPIRPVPSKKRVRRLSITTPDVIERKKSKSAQELNVKQQQELHFHRRLASDFLDREAAVDEALSNSISSEEEENDDHNDDGNEHGHFIDDRQVLTQMPNIDMTSVYLKSIKSPKVYFRPPPPRMPIEDIYSQLPHMTMHDDTDDEEDDSFVDDTTEIVDDHHGEVDFDELANILGTQSVVHRQTKVTRRGVRFGRTSETTTPKRKPKRRVQIAESPM
ncbi:unnamed protein product [Rotaria socialis]|uniref:Fanconi anemia group M protein n=3 Tax=Rotaria socialis TaxID=392032 RepID=A0A818BVX0_9BILA|nr:unnamed protein product [Rotaria socialis]